MFEFQPVIIDHCASPPGRLDVSHSALAPARRITSMSKIRIFGRTAEGTAVAMTVHNFHPTLYISTPQIVDPSELGEWATTTARQLNRALQGEPPRQATTKVVHQGASLERPLVLSVTLVAGRHFYYYSASPRPFLQIALVHASDVKRAAEFFHATTPYDVLEAHIPFDLQFMIAANIFGMGSVAIADGHVEHHRRAEREAGALEISISFADILNQTLVAQSLAARREGASGHFSRSPMMPSVVAMLADLGLGPSAGSPLCPSADAGEMSAATREALPLDAYSKFEGNVRAQYAKVDLADSIQLAAVASLLQPAFHADRDVPGCNSSLQRRAPTDGAQGALPASVPSHSPFTEALADSPFGGGRANLALSRSVSPTKDDGGNENSQEYSLPGDFFTQSLPTASPPYSKEGPAIAEAILSGIASDTIPQTPASAPMGRGGTLLQSHPPTASELLQSMHLYRLPRHVHTKPFYSSARDQSAAYRAPATGRSIPPLPTRAAFALSLFHPSDEHVDEHFDRDASAGPSIRRRKRYTFAAEPPLNFEEAKRWCAIQDARPKSSSSSDGDSIEGLSQIEAPPPKEGPLPAFKVVEAARGGKRDALLILAAEVFGQCRANLNADPRQDALKCIFYCLHSSFAQPPLYKSGVFKIPPQHNLDEGQGASATLLREETCGFAMHTCTDESHLLRSWVTFVTDADPDIICGFDTETASWGYISARYTAVIGRSLAEDLGRPKMAREELRGGRGDASETGSDGLGAQGSEAGWRTKRRGGLQIFGRIVLNVWRVMRHELALPHHDFEYLSSRILQRHLPLHPPQHLSRWYSTRKGFPNLQRYLASRTRGAIELLLRTETIRKSCEFARLFGVSLQAVLARGSQFKVESLMTRLARLENFLMLTPSKAAIVSMRAFEAVPLVIEPTSRYYVDPVIVLDFQSLYPSIMIAYNLCFSTCLGSITQAFPKALGAATVPSPSAHGAALHRLAAEQLVSVTPNRVAFVKKAVREGTLGRMLSELLEARIAVKSLLARCSATDDSLRGTLEARQVGLKYIATMVFGYTAASYAGRMPSVDIADSIMQVGRGTLERAVRLIEATSRWDAHVVYGDTDSVFVHVPGRSVAEALAIGREIAEAVTGDNPRPIELRLEKVYSPCVILSKKRYFGLKHDAAPKSSPDAPAPPLFDAKGIEVVRRDSCPIVSKIFEKSTGILFQTGDISQVKAYMQRQFVKILAGGHKNLSDFVFCKQVRLGSYAGDGQDARGATEDRHAQQEASDEEGAVEVALKGNLRRTHLPPAAAVAKALMSADPMRAPPWGRRVPYVVTYSALGDRLCDCAVHPEEMLLRPTPLHIHSQYYITKQIIPAASRVFSLLGVDVMDWYRSLRRPPAGLQKGPFSLTTTAARQHPSSAFAVRATCLICAQPLPRAMPGDASREQRCAEVCPSCASQTQQTLVTAACRIKALEGRQRSLYEASQALCSGGINGTAPLEGQAYCTSIHCAAFWLHVTVRQHDAYILSRLRRLVDSFA